MDRAEQIAAAYRRIRSGAHRQGSCLIAGGTPTAGGYATIRVGGRTQYAHRVAYEHRHGPIPPGIEISHTCDTPPCIADRHHRPRTHAENLADMAAKQRGRRVAPHLTAAEASTIRLTFLTGEATQGQLAAAYGIHRSHVTAIIARRKWATAA